MPIRSSDWNISRACCLVRDMASYTIILTEHRALRQIRGMTQNCRDVAGYVLPQTDEDVASNISTGGQRHERRTFSSESTGSTSARPPEMQGQSEWSEPVCSSARKSERCEFHKALPGPQRSSSEPSGPASKRQGIFPASTAKRLRRSGTEQKELAAAAEQEPRRPRSPIVQTLRKPSPLSFSRACAPSPACRLCGTKHR